VVVVEIRGIGKLERILAMKKANFPPPKCCKVEGKCRNSSFGLTTKAKGLQGCGPKGSPGIKARRSSGVTSHTPGSVRKCEGV